MDDKEEIKEALKSLPDDPYTLYENLTVFDVLAYARELFRKYGKRLSEAIGKFMSELDDVLITTKGSSHYVIDPMKLPPHLRKFVEGGKSGNPSLRGRTFLSTEDLKLSLAARIAERGWAGNLPVYATLDAILTTVHEATHKRYGVEEIVARVYPAALKKVEELNRNGMIVHKETGTPVTLSSDELE